MNRFFKYALSAALLGSFAAPVFAQDTETPEDAILILDGSGSMWGQIDGVNKIVIAKDVVEGLVRALPDDQRLGMVAYGHRKKGDCTDIQTLAEVGADRDTVIDQIRSITPVGMTPLTKSVEHAATALDYTKNAATVILVSDGLETCEADPCALARTLEENGLDFTVHVVGFDVTEEERRGLQCIASETGGEFLAADSASELNEALNQVAMTQGPVEPSAGEGVVVPQTVALKATILKNGPDIQSKLNWIVTDASSGETVFERDDAGYVDFEVPPGDYLATATWTGWPHQSDRYSGDKTGTATFTIAAAPTVVTVPIDLDIPVSLEADRDIIEGEPVNISWSGPDDLGVEISTNALDDGPREHIYFTPGQKARDAYENASMKSGDPIDSNGDGTFDQDDIARSQIGGPSVQGEYEVRYTLNSPRVILARVPLTVSDGDYSLDAPNEAEASSTIIVDWDGPLDIGGALFIEKPDLASAYARGPSVQLKQTGSVEISAPAEPGEYELRYVMFNGYTTYPGMQHAVQLRRPLTITSVDASITAPETVTGGSMMAMQIETPGEWEDDVISVIETGALKTNAKSRNSLSRMKQEDGSFEIRVPDIAGEYEIAYFLNPFSRVIARKSLTIEQADATVEAPASVKVGEAFEVRYSGEAFSGDRIIIAPADTPDNKMWGWSANYGFFAKAGETVGTYRAVQSTKNLEPGEYEARYVTGLEHIVLARDAFSVTE